MARCYLPDMIRRFTTAPSRCRNTAGRAAAGLLGTVLALCASDAHAQFPPSERYTGQPSGVQQVPYQQSGIDPATLEPVGYRHRQQRLQAAAQPPVHPVMESWQTPYRPRYPYAFREAFKDSLRGFYGSIDYVHMKIDRPTGRVFGNYTDLPDFNDATLAGYVSPFGAAPEQPLRGTLSPGETFVIDSQGSVFSPPADQFVFNPFSDPTDLTNNTFTPTVGVLQFIVTPGANLVAPQFGRATFEELDGIRGTFGYEFGNGAAIEFNVFDLGTDIEQIGIKRDVAQFPIDPNNPDTRLRPIFLDNTTITFVDGGRQNLTFIPIQVTDLTLDLPTDGIGPTVGAVIGDTDANLADVTAPLLPLYFDGGFALDYTVDVNAAESNIFWPVQTPHRRLSLDFSFGARYLNVEEALLPALAATNAAGQNVTVTAVQTRALFNPLDFAIGTFPNIPFDATNGLPEIGEPRLTTISADVENNLYAAQVGFRSELDLDWLTLGISPKLALGVNHSEAQVQTSQLFRATDTATIRKSSSWEEFATVLDLGLYAKVQLREWLSASVGYQMILADGVAHAPDILEFRSSTTDPSIGVKEVNDDIFIQGLTIGFEVLFP